MVRLRFVVSMLVIAAMTSGFLLGDDKNEKDPVIVKAQLPRYYGKLDLNDRQKKTIYSLRAKYASKIEELQRQIDELKAQEKKDLDKVLTDAQMARLKEIRAGGAAKEKEQDVNEKPAPAKKP
jgi:hypothetical protein